eukprot:scaffold3301_cov141-Skeletonema_dohrnii-CCMP3373.AAC.1
MQEGPITDADGLVDITDADEDAFNNLHIVAIHAAKYGRKAKREFSEAKNAAGWLKLLSHRYSRRLFCWCDKEPSLVPLPIWLTPTPITSSLAFSHPYHYH